MGEPDLSGLDGFVVKVFKTKPKPTYLESVFVVADSESEAIEKTRNSYKEGPSLEFTTTRTRKLQPGVYFLGLVNAQQPIPGFREDYLEICRILSTQ